MFRSRQDADRKRPEGRHVLKPWAWVREKPIARTLVAGVLVLVAAGVCSAGPSIRKLPEPVATVALTAPGSFAIHGPAPIACDPSSHTVYVVDRAGFRVIPIGTEGHPPPPLTYSAKGPGGQVFLVGHAVVAGGALYLASPDVQVLQRVKPGGGGPEAIGLAAGGLPFLQVPSRLAPSPDGLGVWDPGLKMVVTISLEGKILAAEKRVGLTPWATAGGGHMFVSENPDGSWHLKGTHGGYDALLESKAGSFKALSCELVGPAPEGGWVVHHYLGGEDGRPAAACLRWLDRSGQVATEAIYTLGTSEDLPAPPGSTCGPDGRVWFLSGSATQASVMVAGP